jgi:hypothetical protein
VELNPNWRSFLIWMGCSWNWSSCSVFDGVDLWTDELFCGAGLTAGGAVLYLMDIFLELERLFCI